MEKNPVHKFTTTGTCTATLTVTNDGGSASKSMTITVNPKKPVARLDQNKYSDKVPLTVKFTDKSLNNPTSYLWRFGDGATSTEKSPTHTYTQPGVYIVRLTATNSGGSDSAISFAIALPRWWFW
jgi:PKD repeat protein